MTFSFDREADAAYIALSAGRRDGDVAQTVELLPAPNGVLLHADYDAAGFLFGIEVIGATRVLRPERIDPSR